MQHLTWTARAHVRVLGATAIILDVTADRYLRIPATTAQAHACLVDQAGAPVLVSEAVAKRLGDEGLVRSTNLDTQSCADESHFWPVLAACAWADIMLRTRRLDLALAQLRYLKQLAPAATAPRSPAVYETWRPLYPRDYVCLFDSLSLTRYLLRGARDPRLVIGVRDAPFSAHAWVWLDGSVVNDRLGAWGSYQPILEI